MRLERARQGTFGFFSMKLIAETMLRLAVTVSRNINKARTALFINTLAYGITVITLLDGPQNLEIPNLTPFMQDAEKKSRVSS